MFLSKKLIKTENIDVEGVMIVKKTFDLIDSGSCSCWKDCDCYKDKGKVKGQSYGFMHPLKNKNYDDLKTCMQSYNQNIKNKSL